MIKLKLSNSEAEFLFDLLDAHSSVGAEKGEIAFEISQRIKDCQKKALKEGGK